MVELSKVEGKKYLKLSFNEDAEVLYIYEVEKESEHNLTTIKQIEELSNKIKRSKEKDVKGLEEKLTYSLKEHQRQLVVLENKINFLQKELNFIDLKQKERFKEFDNYVFLKGLNGEQHRSQVVNYLQEKKNLLKNMCETEEESFQKQFKEIDTSKDFINSFGQIEF